MIAEAKARYSIVFRCKDRQKKTELIVTIVPVMEVNGGIRTDTLQEITEGGIYDERFEFFKSLLPKRLTIRASKTKPSFYTE